MSASRLLHVARRIRGRADVPDTSSGRGIAEVLYGMMFHCNDEFASDDSSRLQRSTIQNVARVVGAGKGVDSEVPERERSSLRANFLLPQWMNK